MSSASIRPAAPERELLASARAGDEIAFRHLVEPYQRELHAHCYRMLASVHDADDALQDVLLRAWRALGGFEGRSSLRSWLFKIATNSCLNAIARRPKRVLPIDYGPSAPLTDDLGETLPDSMWVEPYADAPAGLGAPEASYALRESVELAFIAALQHLPPRQRAVLILREVLGFSAREVADTLDTTTASVNSSMQRARAAIDERLPDQSQQATLRALGDERIRELVEGFVEAWDTGDVDTMVALLADEPTFAMPPHTRWYRGRDAVEAFLPQVQGMWRIVPVGLNGQLAFGAYRWDDEAGSFTPRILDVLTLRDGRIGDVTAFAAPELFGRFGLPAELRGSASSP